MFKSQKHIIENHYFSLPIPEALVSRQRVGDLQAGISLWRMVGSAWAARKSRGWQADAISLAARKAGGQQGSHGIKYLPGDRDSQDSLSRAKGQGHPQSQAAAAKPLHGPALRAMTACFFSGFSEDYS